MKKILSIILISTVLFAGCSKEEEASVSTSGYTAKVDGEKWKASSISASVYNGTIVVIGHSADGTTLTFSLIGDSVGLYAVDENTNSSATYALGTDKTKSFTSGGSSIAGGQVLIESISQKDKRMTGSLSFDAVRASDDSTIKITDGSFINIRFDNIPLGLNSNSLKTQVNGSNWSPQDITGFVAFKTLYLEAIDADGIRKLTFEIPELIGPGKYELNYFTKYKSVYTNISGKNFYAINGTLEIVSHNLVNKELVAKFELVSEAHEGGGKVTFTEGEFLIVYE